MFVCTVVAASFVNVCRDGLGAVRAELSLLLARTAVGFIGKSGSGRLTAWFEGHRAIERIAKLRALLTIHDTVIRREGVRGSRELQLFKQHYFGGR